MNCFTDEQLNRITNIVREIEKLNDTEKLFLYLQLPCGRAEFSEGKFSKQNGRNQLQRSPNSIEHQQHQQQHHHHLNSKKPDLETTQTYTWILSHLELDQNVSLPKQEVYDEYKAYCQLNRIEPLCVADFGKAMKHAFPCIKPRRLGQRGNSRYCYSGLRKRYELKPPSLPDLRPSTQPLVPTLFGNSPLNQQQPQMMELETSCVQSCCRSTRYFGDPIQTTQPSNSIPQVRDVGTSHPRNMSGMMMNVKLETGHNQYQQNSIIDDCRTCGPTFMNDMNVDCTGDRRCPPRSVCFGTANSCESNSPNSDLNVAGCRVGQPIHLMQANPSGPQSHSLMQAQQSEFSSHKSKQSGCELSDQASLMSIQPPGTPDDDDYRHNYQHIEPTLFTNLQASNHQMLATQHSDLGHSMTPSARPMNSQAVLISSTSSTPYDSYNDHDFRCSDKQAYQSTGTPHTGYESPVQNRAKIVLQNTCMINVNSSRFDTCASPFQSPASTPFSHMTGPPS